MVEFATYFANLPQTWNVTLFFFEMLVIVDIARTRWNSPFRAILAQRILYGTISACNQVRKHTTTGDNYESRFSR
jgi:hypothetical protein